MADTPCRGDVLYAWLPFWPDMVVAAFISKRATALEEELAHLHSSM